MADRFRPAGRQEWGEGCGDRPPLAAARGSGYPTAPGLGMPPGLPGRRPRPRDSRVAGNHLAQQPRHVLGLHRHLDHPTAAVTPRRPGEAGLIRAEQEHGRHRGEIQKLFVLTASRGRGISRQLLETAEAAASLQGRTLLVLDTEAGSPAESVYQHLGWQKAGEIPDYAANPDGHLRATAYYYKRL